MDELKDMVKMQALTVQMLSDRLELKKSESMHVTQDTYPPPPHSTLEDSSLPPRPTFKMPTLTETPMETLDREDIVSMALATNKS
jgi:hypothetical protein